MRFRKINLKDYSKSYQKIILRRLTAIYEERYEDLQELKLKYTPTRTIIDRSIEDVKAQVKLTLRRGVVNPAAEKLFRELRLVAGGTYEEVYSEITRAQLSDYKSVAEKNAKGSRRVINQFIKANNLSDEDIRDFLSSEDNVPIFDPPSPRLKRFIDEFGFSPMVARFIDHFGGNYMDYKKK